MIIEVENKDEEGNIVFKGTLNKEQVSFLLGVGVNYLMQQGALDLFEDDDTFVHNTPETAQ